MPSPRTSVIFITVLSVFALLSGCTENNGPPEAVISESSTGSQTSTKKSIRMDEFIKKARSNEAPQSTEEENASAVQEDAFGENTGDAEEPSTELDKAVSANELYRKALAEIRNFEKITADEGREKLNKAIKYIDQATTLMPDSSRFQYLYAALLRKRGQFYDGRATYWKMKSGGLELDPSTGAIVAANSPPTELESFNWLEESKGYQKLADKDFSNAIMCLDCMEKSQANDPKVLDVRARILIRMAEFQKARDIYKKLSEDSRLTDEQKEIAAEMVKKIDKDTGQNSGGR
ncbi:MAG: tetratricopeptide repeat protein [Planctomycetota bacterium]